MKGVVYVYLEYDKFLLILLKFALIILWTLVSNILFLLDYLLLFVVSFLQKYV